MLTTEKTSSNTQQLVEIREQQRESWNKFSPGWKKWDNMFMDFLRPMGDEIVRRINPKKGETILDVASGTGEPGLTIAEKTNPGPVFITDLSQDMLAIARENASHRAVKNVEFKTCDVCELPFESETFDAVSCRFGFMFFPDMNLAIREMARVLKPGGRIATSVWNIPEKNFWVTAIMGMINKNMELPPPPPGAPGMFRCAKEGLMTGLFSNAGLQNVSVTEVTGKLNCKTVDVYWTVMTELAAPVVAALGKADEATRQRIKDDVFAIVNQNYPDGNVVIDASALVVYGEK
jgi:ubiquinone/menaquinone biosynthesis C-methylase UbiE